MGVYGRNGVWALPIFDSFQTGSGQMGSSQKCLPQFLLINFHRKMRSICDNYNKMTSLRGKLSVSTPLFIPRLQASGCLSRHRLNGYLA